MRRLLRLLGFDVHVWTKRNPFTRTCKHCGHTQDFYVWDFEEGEVPIGWETMFPLAKSPCTGRWQR